MRAAAATAHRVDDEVIVTAGFRVPDRQHITLVETEEAGVYAGRTSAPSVVSDTRADRDLLRRLVAVQPTPEIPATTH